MLPTNFTSCTLTELSLLTGIAKCKWSLYFNNKSTISEKTLTTAALKLGMEPGELLNAINERRKLKKLVIEGLVNDGDTFINEKLD